MAIRWSIRRRPGVTLGCVEVPGGLAPVRIVTSGRDDREALDRAAVIAKQLVNSDVFKAVAPPGTAAAVAAISYLARSRDVRSALARFRGPGARRLARLFRRGR